MGRELESCPCVCFNCNQMKVIKMTRPRGNMFLNPGVKSTAVLIKNRCKTRVAKQRSIIKTRKLNLLIKPGISSQRLGSDEFNGSLINNKGTIYSFNPVKPYLLVKKNTEWIRFVSHEKKVKPSISAKPNVLINKCALENQVTYLKVNYPFIPVEHIAINKKSNTSKEKSIYRIERSTLVGAYLFQRRNLKKSHISHVFSSRREPLLNKKRFIEKLKPVKEVTTFLHEKTDG
jgi:hypothetical protein